MFLDALEIGDEIRQVVGMALGWHNLLLWRGNKGWWVVCSKEKVQHYEKIYRKI